MQVYNSGLNLLSKVQNKQNCSDSFNFRGLKRPDDSFCMSYEAQLEKFEAEKLINPNTAFLYNPDLTYEEKVKELKKHPEIVPLSKALSGYKFSAPDLGDGFFAICSLKTPSKTNPLKSKNVKYIDTSFEYNTEVLSEISPLKKNLVNFKDFRNQYDIDDKTFFKYLKLGRFVRFNPKYQSADISGAKSRIINTSDERNIQTLKNINKLDQHSEILDKLLNAGRNEPVMLNVLDLKQFGISNVKAVANAVCKGLIDGTITEKTFDDGSKKTVIKVNLNTRASQQFISKLRSQQCMIVEDFSKQYDISMTEIEDAIFEDKIDFYPKSLFPTDWGKYYVDVNSQKNIDYFNKLLLEKELEKEIAQKNANEIKDKNNTKSSLRMKLAWSLMPNTRAVAKELADGDYYLGYLISKKERIEAQTKEVEENTELLAEDEPEIETLTNQEQSVILSYFKKMWDEAGVSEFKEALSQADLILQQAEEYGIDSIEDKNIRNLLLSYNV